MPFVATTLRCDSERADVAYARMCPDSQRARTWRHIVRQPYDHLCELGTGNRPHVLSGQVEELKSAALQPHDHS